jgi:hypothetical protein
MVRADVEEAGKYAADIFGSLLGMEGYVKQIDIRMDFDGTMATLQVLLLPDTRRIPEPAPEGDYDARVG